VHQLDFNKEIYTFLCSVSCFRKSCRLWGNVEKCCRAGQATVENMAHAHCMLVT